MYREILGTGKPEMGEFDKSFYSDSHDIPALYIGGQIVQIGCGYGDWNEKDEDHLRFKLDPEKTYRVIIEEAE